MKNIQNKLVLFLLLVLALPRLSSSQDHSTKELRFEVNKIYPFISISKEKLNTAHTLTDLDDGANKLSHYYKSSWVRKYISVEILTNYKGEIRIAAGTNDIFSQEQKDIMNRADVGTDISVKVKYIPENTLQHNDPKELYFTFTVEPESDATYPGGQQQMKQYLKENAIDKIPADSFKNYDLTAIKFTIDEAGQIINAHVFEPVEQTYKNGTIEKLLLATVRNMPHWKPAEYANGSKVKQEFVLTVGNHENCVIPLLNIRRD